MKEIAAAFLKFGCLGFGGPIAVIAQFEEEFCGRRNWLTRERFSEIYAVLKVMPGPISTQMAIYLGSLRKGRMGGVLAGIAYVLPSFFLVAGLSWLYATQGEKSVLPPGVFTGLQAGAAGVILLSTLNLGKPYRKLPMAWALGGVSALFVAIAPRLEPLVILSAGLIGIAQARGAFRIARPREAVSAAALLFALFWMAFKAGAFVFGTGLAIVPLLEGEAVGHFRWLTHSQFMDGLAIGQVTPGPVVITATFIGFQVAGTPGALAATAGIFLPSFLNVLFILPTVWGKLSRSTLLGPFAAGAFPAVIGGILITTFKLVSTTLLEPVPLAILAASWAICWKWKPPAWAVIPAAGLIAGLLY